MTRRRKAWRLAAGAASTALLLGAVATGAEASGATPGTVRVAQGINPTAIKGATPGASTSPSTPMDVSFVLRERDEWQLAQQVTRGWRGPYLTTGQFADRYGQSPGYVAALQGYLSRFGIATTAQADRLEVYAQGTAGEFDKALSILESQWSIPGDHGGRAQRVHASRRDPEMPTSLAGGILAVLGLSNYQPYASNAVKAVGRRVHASAASTPAIPPGELTPADFVNRYGLASTEAAGDLGQGQTIGIVTLASLDPTVPTTFWNDILGLSTLPDRIQLNDVDGGAGPVSVKSGSDETTLDVEQSGAIAPQSRIDVYQAPNTDYGFVDAYYHAASDNQAGSVSSSWGESETEFVLSVLGGTESPEYVQSFDQAFLELAAQGQSNFTSSADSGAFTAYSDAQTTNLSTDNPADSPFVTAGGGTTLPGTQTYAVTDSSNNVVGTESVTIPEELSWSSDYLWPLYRVLGLPNEAAAVPQVISGSGGGYSVLERRPAYQRRVSGIQDPTAIHYLTPATYTTAQGLDLPTTFDFNPNPSVTPTSSSPGRAVPDLSFNADPQTGYAVYDPQFTAIYGAPIEQYGGTSFVAPQLNAVSAVYQSELGHRVGFWNPVIYAAARSGSSPFTPIDDNTIYSGPAYFSATDASGATQPLAGSLSNNNLYYTGTPGTIYNPATGLGTADLGQLAGFFAQG